MLNLHLKVHFLKSTLLIHLFSVFSQKKIVDNYSQGSCHQKNNLTVFNNPHVLLWFWKNIRVDLIFPVLLKQLADCPNSKSFLDTLKQSFQNWSSHGCATAQNLSDFAQHPEICMQKLSGRVPCWYICFWYLTKNSWQIFTGILPPKK